MQDVKKLPDQYRIKIRIQNLFGLSHYWTWLEKKNLRIKRKL